MREAAILHMGLSKMEHWLDLNTDLQHWVQHKTDRRAQWGDRVYQVLPDALPAAVEFAEMIAAQAATALDDTVLEGFAVQERLWRASLAVPEDLVVMVPKDGAYHLMAASLCSPSHWRLEEKIGRAMREVHDPIPGIHDDLSDRIDRFFEHLKVDHPVERFNWSVQVGDALHALPDNDSLAAQHGEEALFYRVERQTLVRLPETGAIGFTIRVYIDPIETLAQIDGALPALLAAIDAASPEIAQYKGFHRIQPLLAPYRTDL